MVKIKDIIIDQCSITGEFKPGNESTKLFFNWVGAETMTLEDLQYLLSKGIKFQFSFHPTEVGSNLKKTDHILLWRAPRGTTRAAMHGSSKGLFFAITETPITASKEILAYFKVVDAWNKRQEEKEKRIERIKEEERLERIREESRENNFNQMKNAKQLRTRTTSKPIDKEDLRKLADSIVRTRT